MLAEAVPKKILDMMNVENLTRENVASHLQAFFLFLYSLCFNILYFKPSFFTECFWFMKWLQKYRLYLKRISCVANQQASMVAALGSADHSYLRMGSASGVGHLQALSGSGQFHNNAFNSFSPSGIITGLNAPAGLNVHGFPTSRVLQLGQSRDLNSSNDQLKFHSAITPVNQNGPQGMPMSMGFNHLQNNKGVISVQNLTTDVKTTFPIPIKLPDQRPRVSTSSSYPSSLNISNNALMLATHPQGKQGGMGFESSSSSVASQHSESPFSLLDQGLCNDNWSSAVPLSGIPTNSFPPNECFRQTAIPPTDNMASLPLQRYSGGQSITSLASQSHCSLADIPSQGVTFTGSSEYINSSVAFQGWEDHNQGATYHSNVIGGSINSLTPVNGAVVSADHTRTTSTLHRNLDTKFCNPLQMNNDGFVGLTESRSSRQPRQNLINQQKSQHSRFSNNLGSLEYLASSMMEQVIAFVKFDVGFFHIYFCMTALTH